MRTRFAGNRCMLKYMIRALFIGLKPDCCLLGINFTGQLVINFDYFISEELQMFWFVTGASHRGYRRQGAELLHLEPITVLPELFVLFLLYLFSIFYSIYTLFISKQKKLFLYSIYFKTSHLSSLLCRCQTIHMTRLIYHF